MAEHGDTTPSRVRATPPSYPEISDAVVEAAALVIVDHWLMTKSLGGICYVDRRDTLVCAKAAISAAILADRESSRAEVGRLTQERDAALSAASTAEEVLAKTIASIPVAMTAAAEKEREACAKIIDEQAPFLNGTVSSAVCASLSAAIRNRREAK
ncbi:MAG: hypothetical protein WC683_18760 [bacterium]